MTNKRIFPAVFLLLFIANLFSSIHAQVKLPRLISNGMVLQRNVELKLWGWASPGEKIKIRFKQYELSTSSDSAGNWILKLPPQSAGGPFEMIIEASNKVVLKDVLIGDVWICSGQSNIQTPMSRLVPLYPNEIAESENNFVRYFTVPENFNFKSPQKDFNSGSWMHTNPQNVPGMAGVPYFFAKDLYDKYKIPIGIINSSVGGSPIEAWLGEDVIKNYPEAYAEALKWRNDSLIAKTRKEDNARMGKWYQESIENDPGYAHDGIYWRDPDFDDSGWNDFEMPSMLGDAGDPPVNGIFWFRKKFVLSETESGKPAKLELGRIKDADSVFVNGIFVGGVTYEYPPRRYEIPGGVLKTGDNTVVVRLISSYGLGGFIPDKPYNIKVGEELIDLSGKWKFKQAVEMEQLEPQTFIRWKPTALYNAMLAPLFSYAIKGVVWYQGEANTMEPEKYTDYLPALVNDWRKNWQMGTFPFLYVQLANYMETKEEPDESNWALLRDIQRRSLTIENSAMTVAIELGEWNDIHPMNKKDVAGRLSLGAQYLAYGEKDIVYSGPLYSSMDINGTKVILSFRSIGSGLMVKGGGELKYFAIAGEDGKFLWAKAKIEGEKVIVWSEEIDEPVEVRYAWADNPEGANLYNKEGLPASPFSTADK